MMEPKISKQQQQQLKYQHRTINENIIYYN